MTSSTRPFARLFFAAALSALTLLVPVRPALAASDYSDVWVNADEPGWGVSILQWGNTMFASFFIYGADNKPTWYVAVLNADGLGRFTGTLFAEQGTYFKLPWVPSDQVETVAGSAIFQPSTSNNYQGTFVYTVNAANVIVTSQVQRMTVVSVPLAGTYYGGQSGAYKNCTSTGDNTNYFDYYKLVVTQTGTNASLTFTFPRTTSSDLVCTLSGAVSQNGLLYGINSATYLCSDQLDTTATLSDIKITAQGIEGVLAAPLVGGGCREDARFSAVKN